MRVRLEFSSPDDAPACRRAALPVVRGNRGVALATRSPEALIPSPCTTPAPVLTDGGGDGAPRPDGRRPSSW